MEILRPIDELIDGTCFGKFDLMTNDKKIDTVIKTALVAIAAGLVISIVSPCLAVLTFPVVSLYAFSYFTSQYGLTSFALDQGKQLGRTLFGFSF